LQHLPADSDRAFTSSDCAAHQQSPAFPAFDQRPLITRRTNYKLCLKMIEN
jgi:hypothetical protein